MTLEKRRDEQRGLELPATERELLESVAESLARQEKTLGAILFGVKCLVTFSFLLLLIAAGMCSQQVNKSGSRPTSSLHRAPLSLPGAPTASGVGAAARIRVADLDTGAGELKKR